MLCRNPTTMAGGVFPCGQCMPCRVNKRRIWSHRIMLEAMQHSDNAFVTLTYDPEKLPVTKDQLPTLVPKDLQDWLKRFRKAIEPQRIRYFAVGEYGDETHRPHYHLAVFGYPTCRFGNSIYSKRRLNCCPQCDAIRDTWGKGQVMLGTLEDNSAQYIAGYVTKKMTSKDDFRLNGRFPEFARMSLRPGIGADAMHEIASALMQFNLEETQADVPSALRHGKRLLPLGRYLKQRLRLYCGKDIKTPEAVIAQMAEDLRPLREAAFDASQPLSEAIARAADGKVARMESKLKLYKKRSSI